MFLTISIVIAIIYGLCNPFFTRLNATGIWAGRAIASPDSENTMSNGFHDAITHGWPSTFVFLFSILPLLSFIAGFIHKWWFSFVGLFLSIVFYAIFEKLGFMPKNIIHYLTILFNNIKRRRSTYEKKGDFERMRAADFLVQNLDKIIGIYTNLGIPAPSTIIAKKAPYGNLYYLAVASVIKEK